MDREMFRIDGKTALITGGTSGIGLAAARLFAESGARGVVCGRSAEDGASVARGFSSVRADIRSASDRAHLRTVVERELDGLDVLFLNAGIADFPRFEEIDEERYDELFDVNVRGTFFLLQALLPVLRPGASVIVTTSVAGAVGLPRLALYGASKAALAYLAKSLSAELAPRNIRVNALSPGPTETPIHGKYGVRLTPEEMQAMGADTMGRSLVGRLASADEIAAGALYLASDAAALLRGHELVLDGGIGL